MDHKHIEDWEKDLQNGLLNETMPTDENDFNDFMGQLDDSGYFEEDPKRPMGWWILGGGIAVLLLTYLLWPVSKGLEKKDEIKRIEKPLIEKVKEVPNETEVVEQVEEFILKSDEKPEPEVQKPAVIKSDEKPVELAKKEIVVDTVLFEEPIVIEQEKGEPLKDKEEEPKPVVKKKPTVIIMTTDTTVIRDTSHVKEKRRKKKKK